MKKINKERVINLYGLIWTSIVILIYIIQPCNLLKIEYFSNIDKLIMITGMIYVLVYRFYLKKNIIKNKFDFLFIIFFLTMIIPLITNTYISLSSTVQYILKYTNFILVYFIVKSSITKDKYIETFLNILLLAISIVTIYGIDTETTRFVNNTLGLMNYKESADYNIYKFNYIYHNVLAIVMLVGIVISQYKLIVINSNKKIIIYMSMFFSSVGFYLAFSRISIFIFAIFEIILLVIYIVKKQNLKELLSFYISFIMAVVFSDMLKQGIFNDNNLKLWICFIGIILVNCFICKLIEIIKIKKIKININKLIPFFIAIFIILFIFIVIALNTSSPIVINENNISDVGARFYTIKAGNPGEYCFVTVDYELGNYVTEYVEGELIGYNICFFGVLENGNYEWIGEIPAVKGNQNREFYFKYNPKYVELKVKIESVSNKIEDITINLMQVDGKEYILNYKYIPYPIVYFINSISFNNVSVSERISLYKDAFNICLKNKFIGLGANAWKHIFEECKAYNYYTSEVHSRILEILISFGILGLTVYILLIVYYLKYNLNKLKEFNFRKWILICIPIMIFIQASIDWILSENVVLLIMFLLLGIINYDINDRKNKFKILESIILVVFCLILLLIVYSWIIEIYVEGYNKVNRNVFQQKYVSDYLLFRDEDRKEKWNNLQGLINDNTELNNEIFNLLYIRLKYERNIDCSLNLLQYLQIAQYSDLEIDMKLVDTVINNLRPDNKYSVQIICEYITNLYYIKQFSMNLGVKEEQLNLITKKMQYEYEELIVKLEDYDKLSMNYDYFEPVNPENIELILESIDEYKKFCYN